VEPMSHREYVREGNRRGDGYMCGFVKGGGVILRDSIGEKTKKNEDTSWGGRRRDGKGSEVN